MRRKKKQPPPRRRWTFEYHPPQRNLPNQSITTSGKTEAEAREYLEKFHGGQIGKLLQVS